MTKQSSPYKHEAKPDHGESPHKSTSKWIAAKFRAYANPIYVLSRNHRDIALQIATALEHSDKATWTYTQCKNFIEQRVSEYKQSNPIKDDGAFQKVLDSVSDIQKNAEHNKNLFIGNLPLNKDVFFLILSFCDMKTFLTAITCCKYFLEFEETKQLKKNELKKFQAREGLTSWRRATELPQLMKYQTAKLEVTDQLNPFNRGCAFFKEKPELIDIMNDALNSNNIHCIMALINIDTSILTNTIGLHSPRHSKKEGEVWGVFVNSEDSHFIGTTPLTIILNKLIGMYMALMAFPGQKHIKKTIDDPTSAISIKNDYLDLLRWIIQKTLLHPPKLVIWCFVINNSGGFDFRNTIDLLLNIKKILTAADTLAQDIHASPEDRKVALSLKDELEEIKAYLHLAEIISNSFAGTNKHSRTHFSDAMSSNEKIMLQWTNRLLQDEQTPKELSELLKSFLQESSTLPTRKQP